MVLAVSFQNAVVTGIDGGDEVLLVAAVFFRYHGKQGSEVGRVSPFFLVIQAR